MSALLLAGGISLVAILAEVVAYRRAEKLKLAQRKAGRVPRRRFADLRAQMSPESQARADERSREIARELTEEAERLGLYEFPSFSRPDILP
jgi:hypothetical protein